MESQELAGIRQPQDVRTRVTKNQKIKLVDYMSNNMEFAKGLPTGVNGSEETRNKWKSLAAELNSCGSCVKTPDQWKKCWQDMKNSVKKLEVAKRKFMSRTSGGSLSDPDAPRHLNNIEGDILKIMTSHAVEGDGVTPEGGFGQATLPETRPLERDDERETDDLTAQIDEETPPRKRQKNSFQSLHAESLKVAKQMQTESLEKMDKLIEGNTNVLRALENTTKIQLQLCQSVNKLVESLKK